jgi:DNA-binding HxlR family transcriptional regulator
VKRTSFAGMSCSVAKTLDIVGEWWTLLILRDSFLGVTRFDDWQRRLGIARNVLSARLDVLVEQGILERRQYHEHPPRDEYVLTRKGSDLAPVLDALRVWGDHYLAPDGPPALLVHDDCGAATTPVVHCSHCGERLRRGHVHMEPGPANPDAAFLLEGRPARSRRSAGELRVEHPVEVDDPGLVAARVGVIDDA